MAEQGKSAVIFGSDGLFSGDFTIEGSYVSSFAPDIKGIPEDAELVQTYTDQYGEFGTFGPPTYEAARVVMEAITRVCESGGDPLEGHRARGDAQHGCAARDPRPADPVRRGTATSASVASTSSRSRAGSTSSCSSGDR